MLNWYPPQEEKPEKRQAMWALEKTTGSYTQADFDCYNKCADRKPRFSLKK
jgi:hypothetical protein